MTDLTEEDVAKWQDFTTWYRANFPVPLWPRVWDLDERSYDAAVKLWAQGSLRNEDGSPTGMYEEDPSV